MPHEGSARALRSRPTSRTVSCEAAGLVEGDGDHVASAPSEGRSASAASIWASLSPDPGVALTTFICRARARRCAPLSLRPQGRCDRRGRTGCRYRTGCRAPPAAPPSATMRGRHRMRHRRQNRRVTIPPVVMSPTSSPIRPIDLMAGAPLSSVRKSFPAGTEASVSPVHRSSPTT